MSLSRRRLFQRFGSAPLNGEWIAARGREAAVAEGSLEFAQQQRAAASSNVIRIASNENPLGPGQHVVDIIVGKFPEAGRYPFNAQQREPVLVKALASKYGVSDNQIALGPGSGEILSNSVRAFTLADQTAGDGLADLREPARHRPQDWHRSACGGSRRQPSDQHRQARRSVQGCGSRLLLQSRTTRQPRFTPRRP